LQTVVAATGVCYQYGVDKSRADNTYQWLPLQLAKITPEDGSELRPKHVEL